jgi:hypothetical protein
MLQGMLIQFARAATNNYANNGGASVFADVLALFVLSFFIAVIVWNIGALSSALTGAAGGIGQGTIQTMIDRFVLRGARTGTKSPTARAGGGNLRPQGGTASVPAPGSSGFVPASQRAAQANL